MLVSSSYPGSAKRVEGDPSDLKDIQVKGRTVLLGVRPWAVLPLSQESGSFQEEGRL